MRIEISYLLRIVSLPRAMGPTSIELFNPALHMQYHGSVVDVREEQLWIVDAI